MLKVVLIDDEPIIVEGLSRSVDWTKFQCRVVGTANDGMSGKKLIEETAIRKTITEAAPDTIVR